MDAGGAARSVMVTAGQDDLAQRLLGDGVTICICVGSMEDDVYGGGQRAAHGLGAVA